jgi:hypothetical protein
MSIRLATVAFVPVFALSVAAPAQAWFGGGWLEKLSGPGPFGGPTFDVRLVCLTEPRDPSASSIPADRGDLGWSLTFPKADGRRGYFTLAGCHFLDRDQPRLEVGLQHSRLSAGGANNPLDYTHRPEAAGLDKGVDLRVWLLTADVRVNRAVDVGAAVGRVTFRSPGGVFASFGEPVLQPIRVTVRPLSAMVDDRRVAETLSVRADLSRFANGFTAEQFGARPGTFSEPDEWLWGYQVLVDLSTFFWR